MARVIITTDFDTARDKLASIGITLTTHPHKKGGFVCYVSRKERKKLNNYEGNE